MKNLRLYRIPLPEFMKLYNQNGEKVTVITVEQERIIGRVKYRVPNYYMIPENKREELERLMLEAQAECGFDFYAVSQNPHLVAMALEQMALCKLGKNEELDESIDCFDFNQTIYYNQNFLNNVFHIFAAKLFNEGEELTGLSDLYFEKSMAVTRLCLEKKIKFN